MDPTTPAIPIVETPRLRLRGHRLADFAELAAMWGEPEVTRFISGAPASEEESWGRLLRYAGHWAMLGFGYWAVEERETGCYLGDIGFADYRRAIEPPLDAPEMGWVLSREAAGAGFATEAVRAAVRWADLHLAVPRTVCIIAPDHARSMRVAEKAGFRQVGLARYKEAPRTVWERGRAPA